MGEMTMPGKFQSVVDAQIRAAEARGAFDNLPGAGKPIPGLMDPDDPDWWIKGFIKREKVPAEVLLPPSLALRREVEKLPETVRKLRSEQAVREQVEDLNIRIRRWIQIPIGPQLPVAPVDVDAVVAAWAEQRRSAPPSPPPTPAPPPPRRRWWHRRHRA
jgi:DnaJ homologue, subfamily C, member 28, conserved domain